MLVCAEAASAPVVKALLGKAVIPDHSPYTTEGLGLLRTAPSQDGITAMRHLHRDEHEFPLYEVSAETGIIEIDSN